MAITIGTSTMTVSSGAVMAAPTGNAALFFCRAYLNYNGQHGSIRGQKGISHVTDVDFGLYRVFFANAMADSSYTTLGSANGSGVSIIPIVSVNQDNDQTDSYVDIYTTGGVNGTPLDFYNVNVAIFS